MASTEYSFSRSVSPDVIRVATPSDANEAIIINLPDWAYRVTIRPESKKVRMSFVEGTSDNINNDFIKLSSDTSSEFIVSDGDIGTARASKVYIANVSGGGGASINVSIMVEGE